jgi:hypothetical protein
MPDLVILRLHPAEPISGSDFTAFLSGLTITAFDLSFADSVGGVQIGMASGLANPHLGSTTNNNVNINNTSILQHYVDVNDPPPLGPLTRKLEAAATAVIVVNAPAGHHEYPNGSSYDIRLEIKRNGLDIIDRTLDYNVTVTTVGSLSNDQTVYFGMTTSAYVTLPSSTVGLDPSLAFVELPDNGQAPKFDDLVKAINLVLAKDPADGNDLAHRPQLTAAQSHQVASEIIWNRKLFPPPEPPRSLGDLYTKPPVNPVLAGSTDEQNRAEQDRKQFEAELTGYHAKHDAEALRLAGFVFSASAAVACEVMSKQAARAGLAFPLITGASSGTTIPDASVILTDPVALNPDFIVPAAYFYALGANLPPQVSAQQRYDMARFETEPRLLSEFQTAVDAGAVTVPSAPLTVASAPKVNSDQAARRLHALGSTTGSAPEVLLAPPVTVIVGDWLAFTGASANINSLFWTLEIAAQPGAYLELILRAVTGNHQPLISAITGPPHNVANVAGLVAINDQQWRDFFLAPPPNVPVPTGPPPRTALLPPFTQPGTPAERVEAFIRHLRKFFAVPFAPGAAQALSLAAPPTLALSIADIFQQFTAAYAVHGGGAFAFGGPLNMGALQQALADVFPGDLAAQAWLQQAIETIDGLFRITDIGSPELQFSLMEALYARGFTGAASVQGLSQADFQEALIGTVAYSHAAAIYAKAGAVASVLPPKTGFKPVNQDGSLVDCVPPLYLSPLGPVEYLCEMLKVSAASTCENPMPDGAQSRLEVLLAGRRGSLGDLHATRANLETPLPLIDLVNESLEALTAGLPGATGGAVYDTAGDQLAGHKLLNNGSHTPHAANQPFAHDPQTLFAVTPEHSSPATPVKKPAAYDKLKVDFTAPALPYAQALDVCRSYLHQLGANRFEVMRRFRKEITEFVIDPAHEPAGFQRHLWRYPVRFEIAREYLGISSEEYDLLYAQDIVNVATPGRLLLREVFGFPNDNVNGRPWSDVVLEAPEFLKRTGLSYCEFLDLWRAQFVSFVRAGEMTDFPECEPCCPNDLRIVFVAPQDPLVALRKLAVFIRLWRRLQEVRGPKITFAQLRDICDVLGLFNADAINPDFIRQLAALLMLRDFMCLPLTDGQPVTPGGVGADRTHLLALWVGPVASKWDWALDLLLDHIEDYAEARHASLRHTPELIKIIKENLDLLSRLAGFDPAIPTDTWNWRPTNTLRFVEALSKIYASDFTVGELLFLFTNENHLEGDDPFPMPDQNEAYDMPLNLPEDDLHGLWALRRKLLGIEVDEEAIEAWTWPRISATLRDKFGFAPPSGGPDALDVFGERFFPSVLEGSGHPVPLVKRQYRVNLPSAGTSPLMWNTPPSGPFHYDKAAEQLWTRIPLYDEAVITALQEMRPLNNAEQGAVRELYFSPRADLVPFSFIFSNFAKAVERLVQGKDEAERWKYFRSEFARFYKRCHVIAEHLSAHVAAGTDGDIPEDDAVAWKVLRHLFADENLATSSWEDDTGTPPSVTWGPQPNGGAFAALLGLTGTGLLAEFSVQDQVTAWREVSDSSGGFGSVRNKWNAPVPTILPAMGLTLTPEQQRFVTARNGFALRDANGEPLGGAQPFHVRWSGVLLIEQPGHYCFHAGAPTADGKEADFEAAREHRWRLTLSRGQKSWILLNHRWPGEDAPDLRSGPLALRRGAYKILVEFEQKQPTFSHAEEVCPQHSGFQVKYAGPDSGDCLVAIPIKRLFRDMKAETLGKGINLNSAVGRYLNGHYTSTLRDIRRTYQRAFKAVLFAHRFRLSAQHIPGDRQSELGYMLDHGAAFLGTSYPRTGASSFTTHHAHFNFNFLPVSDPYRPPPIAQDQRQQPSAKRQAALFDWWERIWDYCLMRRETRPARERPAWLLFYEASERQPDDPPQLVRHLGVDIRHAPLVLNYFSTPPYAITTPDLEDERWAVRVWHGEKWVRSLRRHFFPEWIGAARPDLWASDDPGVELGAPPLSGNENLTQFVRNGCFENGEPRRYEDVKRLNDGLRGRARRALLAYLCGMNRVPLPWGPGLHALAPGDLGDLLLEDVETGICEKASRIEDAISAVQTFVQRARLGLEPGFTVSPAFARLWDRRFATFHIWQACKRRDIYHENWIAWEEIEKAQKTEAFRFLESELRRGTLTAPVPGGMEWWPNQRPPGYLPLSVLQAREPAEIQLLRMGPTPEGFGLLGAPERDARPSWLAPILRAPINRGGDDDHNNGNGDHGDPRIPGAPNSPSSGGDGPLAVRDEAIALPPNGIERLPLWIQAAIRLGTRFIRVAAAGAPPASTGFVPLNPAQETGCCADCGKAHPPVIDEYYFWLQDTRYFDVVSQDADQGAQPPNDPKNDTTSDWGRPEKLPGLLNWDSGPMVHLFWARFHNGEFLQPRRSDEGLRIDPGLLTPGGAPQLEFMGRTADSLRFEVSAGKVIPGYLDPTRPGFRYDLATDSAVVLPLLAAPSAPAPTGFPSPLKTYPFFIYFAPGARLEPASPFSVALTVGGALRAHCRYEAALKWYELAFNPLSQDDTWMQCPRQQTPNPNDDPADVPRNSVALTGDADRPCCPSAPVNDAVARDRAIMLQYLETLREWGLALMCRRNSPEAFQQATVIFDTMQRVLGPRPITVSANDDGNSPMTIAAFAPRPAPLNPRLLALYDRTADGLALVHHCLNAHRLRNGRPNLDMPYWGDSPLRNGWQMAHACCDENGWCLICCSAYRFAFLMQKAMEQAAAAQSLGAELLAAYEKGDAEYLASMRSTHERQLLQLTLEARQNQWREADWQLQALHKTKENAQTRKRYFEGLILHGLNAGETGYEALTGVSMASRAAGNISEAVAQGIGMAPDFWFGVAGFAGTPLEFQQLPLGNKLAAVFATTARIMNSLAEIAGSSSSLSLTQGGWDRREDEWRHQVEVIGIEIEQIERQILAAERRRDIALRELNNHQRQMEHAIEVQNFLRDKFTSHQLYLFLQQETAALHRQTYELALATACQAQRAFNYERGHTARAFLPDDAWDNLHEGLLAGERLQLALRRMEKAYLDANCREYELTKHISLRINFPLAFLQLQITGYCEIDIPEWMFDLDYPGHYMRRIKNVTLTIPCIVGPYTGVHCRLTLLSSATRVDPRLIDPAVGCCDGKVSDNGYCAMANDPRIVKSYAATEAIATSSGQNDSGLFELSFRDERYLPFEFAGAISRWRIELPQENNQFDLDTLSDVILHLNYTAREGGEMLRNAANTIAQQFLPGAGVRFFDVRHEFPDAWQILQGCATGGKTHRDLGLRLNRKMFPFLPGLRNVKIHRLELFFEAPGAEPSASHLVKFLAGHWNGHTKEERCDCDVQNIYCIASAEWPGLYHGILDIQAKPLNQSENHSLGTFRFPHQAGEISRVFLVCGYSAV